MDKNPISIRDSADAVFGASSSLSATAYLLGDPNRDPGLIRILDAQVSALRDQTVLLQQAIDEYAK